MSDIELFFKLGNELATYKKMMGEAADIIINSDVSNYPIFVIHQQEVEIGLPIAVKDKVKGNWSVNATTLEELVGKQLIKEAKVDSFRKNFRPTEDFLCLFTLTELGAQFIFIPRK